MEFHMVGISLSLDWYADQKVGRDFLGARVCSLVGVLCWWTLRVSTELSVSPVLLTLPGLLWATDHELNDVLLLSLWYLSQAFL